MKYIDAEKLKAEIERRNLSNYYTTTEGYEEELYEIIDSLQSELPSNLDEAAEEYANKEFPDEPSCGQWGTGDYEPFVDMSYPREIAKDSFKAGAEWMAGQGETIEGEVVKDINNNLVVTAKGFSGKEAVFGDKVIAQIRKK